MIDHAAILLVATVAAVGVLHTLVPDHWGPIVVLARQQGWSAARTARSAAFAGVGHVATTLLLGTLLWFAGAALAVRYAHAISFCSALALLVFGLWIAYCGWRSLVAREEGGDHSHFEHAHLHEHEDGVRHVHWHEHHQHERHPLEGNVAAMHVHEHRIAGRTALLLILGSSPMVEGIPAFFAASTKGPPVLVAMAVALACTTIGTYVVLCVAGLQGLQRAALGPLERYGEVVSGLFVALVGVYALFTF